MHTIKRIIASSFIILYVNGELNSQPAAFPIKKECIFSAIAGTTSKMDSIVLPAATTLVKFISGDTSSFKILSITKKKLLLAFTPAGDFTGIARAILQVKNASGQSMANINCTGLSTPGLEGRNEAPLAQIIDVLGYNINIGWTTLDNHCRPEWVGEEVPSSLFKKSGMNKVELIPVARYSPDFELPFGFYVIGTNGPDRHEVGVLAKKSTYPEHQTLFPATVSAIKSFDPGNKVFGFYGTGAGHSAYSEDAWNMLLHPTHAVRAVRIFPVKNKKGQLLKDTYLVCFEEAKNGDYNDYVFLAKNITPVRQDLFTSLFNGTNLQGWNTFLRSIGKDRDPNKNFRIDNGELFVSGKDLGYAITEKGYRNYHFKVDFKWGGKRWPPRENDKRDAGICYNIPLSEPDSIWPQSIECQIQEGDTGDFWLLGFSTIKVNGVQNVPANHTRMIKQKDAERSSGEWNTVEVISYNGKCVHIVNGVVVNVGEEASVKEGRILLQSEYAEIFYRNIKIRNL